MGDMAASRTGAALDAGAGACGVAPASAVPQPPQNLPPGGLSKPHAAQTAFSGAPQWPKNR